MQSKPQRSRGTERLGNRVLAVVILLAICSVSPLRAQDAFSPDTTEKLHQRVQLTGESTTLAQIAAQLSKQTGLKIEAAAYLGKHRLNLQCDGDSAETILKTLANLNDWQWREVDKGVILISRAPGRRP